MNTCLPLDHDPFGEDPPTENVLGSIGELVNPAPTVHSSPSDEPKPISAAVAMAEGVDAFIAKWEAEKRRAPETTFVLGECRHCGTSLGRSRDDKVINVGHGLLLPNPDIS